MDIPNIMEDIRDFADNVALMAYKDHSAESGTWLHGEIPSVPSCGIGYPMKVLMSVKFISTNGNWRVKR